MSVKVFRLRALSYLFNCGVGIAEYHRSRVTIIPPKVPAGSIFSKVFKVYFNL